MPFLTDALEQLLALLEYGGAVLPAIFATSLLLWVFILERYWFFLFSYPRLLHRIAKDWEGRSDHSSWCARRIREDHIAQLTSASRRFLLPIQTLVSILPLLGLLGTVTGMIQTFEVLMFFGSGNARGLAAGISEALITTTAGLVTAIVGMYFSADLQRRASTEQQKASDLLV